MSSHVFISYAREDHGAAVRLRDDLLKIGVTPWMDAFDLVGGQDWRQAIKQALRSSSHVILLVSTHTVSRRGYVQTEVKEALELLSEFPPGAVFVVPVRLEAVSPLNEDLARLHWVDLFPDYQTGLERITRSLGIEPPTRLKAPPLPVRSGAPKLIAVRSPLTAASAAFILALMYLIMLGAKRPLDEFGKAFRPPEVMVWCILVAAQVAIWSYVAAPAYRRAMRYVAVFRTHRRAVIFDVVALVLLFVIFVYAHRPVTSGLELLVIGQRAKALFLNLLGFATLLPCLLGMRLIAIAAREEAGAGVNTALLDKFARLRADLKWFLGRAAVIIGAATLANGAFMNALNVKNPESQTPATVILLYGGFCSGLLALFYVFSHEVFRKSGWALIKAAEPALDDSTDAWADAQVRRSKLAEMMGVGLSNARRLQIGALLLTPLFGSGVALLLGRT